MSVLKQLQKYFIVRKSYYLSVDNMTYLTQIRLNLHFDLLFINKLGKGI